MLLHHPNRAPAEATPAQWHAAKERFKEVASAWEVLGDAQRQSAYDARHGGALYLARLTQSSASSSAELILARLTNDPRVLTIRMCNPEDMLNLPLFEGYLVLDPRSKVEHAVLGCFVVWTSLTAGTDTPAGTSWSEWWQQNEDDLGHDHHAPVVVLGEAGASQLAESLARFLHASEEEMPRVSGPSQMHDPKLSGPSQKHAIPKRAIPMPLLGHPKAGHPAEAEF